MKLLWHSRSKWSLASNNIFSVERQGKVRCPSSRAECWRTEETPRHNVTLAFKRSDNGEHSHLSSDSRLSREMTWVLLATQDRTEELLHHNAATVILRDGQWSEQPPLKRLKLSKEHVTCVCSVHTRMNWRITMSQRRYKHFLEKDNGESGNTLIRLDNVQKKRRVFLCLFDTPTKEYFTTQRFCSFTRKKRGKNITQRHSLFN